MTDRVPSEPVAGFSPIPLRVAAVAIGLLGLLPASNWFGDGPPVPWWDAAVRPWLLWSIPVFGVALALSALGPRCETALDRAHHWILAPSARAFATGVFLLALALSALFAWYCFHARMTVGDEMSQQFQARLLLNGRLSAVPEQYMEFFNTVETLDGNGRWFSQFPIGGALPLAIGMALHLVWLVNPVFVGWATVSVYRFVRGVSDERFARWTALLFALSPYVLFMAASELNHVPALACILWGVSALPTWATSDDPRAVRRSAWVIGFAFACAASIRPYDAALCAVPVGLMQLVIARGSRTRWTSLGWQLAGGLIPLLLLFIVNWRTTGDPLLFAYDALNGPGHRPGFHLDPRGIEHTPTRGMYLASSYLMRINVSLFEWPLPALVFVLAGMTLARRPSAWDYLFGGILVCVVGGYAAYWHEGFFMMGPRFMYSALPSLVWFTARAVRITAAGITTPLVHRAVYLVVPICVATTWLAPPDPTRLFGVWRVATINHQQHAGTLPDPVADAKAAGLDNALVFVRESWHTALAARLRALGSPPLMTEAFVPQFDACAMQRALDALPPGVAGPDPLSFVLQQSEAAGQPRPVGSFTDQNRRVSLVPNKPLAPACAAEMNADERPGVSLALLLPSADFDSDGRLSGKVVWARDLGPRDTLLRARFGDRQWFRYDAGAATPETRFVRLAK